MEPSVILGTERTIAIEGATFTVRPEQFDDFIAALKIEDAEADEKIMSLARLANTLIRRIVAWDGIGLPDGTPAPCTAENVLRLFGQRPDLVGKLAAALSDAEEEEKKTSEPSLAG